MRADKVTCGDNSASGLTCCVCGKPITSGYYSHHQRLNVDMHGNCPLTDVMGEDVTMHSMMLIHLLPDKPAGGEGSNCG